jgi:acyl carrier protein
MQKGENMTQPKPKPRKPSRIEAKVLTILAEHLLVNEDELTLATRFSEDLHADSIDFIEMVMLMEENFDIREIPDDDAAKLLTVGAVCSYVEKYAMVSA